jgi:replicative DNA helicase
LTQTRTSDPSRPGGRSVEDGGAGGIPGRLPPQNLEAEMSLLGAMMLNREAVGDIIPIIGKDQRDWFYRPDHRLLFETLVELYDRSAPIDLVVVRDELKRRGLLEQVGGVDYIVRCAESVPSAANAVHYAKIIRDKGLLRDLIGCIDEISAEAYADAEPAQDVLDHAEQLLFGVTEKRVSGSASSLSQLIRELHDRFTADPDNSLTGLPTGFHVLDQMTSGFQAGDFVIVAARPSMGKTALGLNMAEHVSVDERRPSAFFSMEMSAQQVAQRLVCSRGGIDAHKFRRRMLNDAEKHTVSMTCAELRDAPLYIDDTPGMTIMELRAKARRLRQQRGIEVVFVDYLQLMRQPGSDSRQEEVAAISRGLKALGRDLRIPIVAMAQLNRQTEGRQGNTPRMSDLRESGAIEQDADVVLLIHREEYYKKDDPSLRGKAELIIDKQRNGPTGKIDLVFNHITTRFNNAAPVDYSGYAAPTERGEAPF